MANTKRKIKSKVQNKKVIVKNYIHVHDKDKHQCLFMIFCSHKGEQIVTTRTLLSLHHDSTVGYRWDFFSPLVENVSQ